MAGQNHSYASRSNVETLEHQKMGPFGTFPGRLERILGRQLLIFFLSTAFLSLFWIGTASAGCSEAARRLGENIDAGKYEVIDNEELTRGWFSSGKAPVAVTTDNGKEVVLPDSEKPVEPRENWFGSPPSLDAVKERIAAAQTEAENGNDDVCRTMLDEAVAILSPVGD